MPTPGGEITTSTIWTQPQEEVQEILPVEEEVKEEE
jgi:microcompartment protein CcmL/EutN